MFRTAATLVGILVSDRKTVQDVRTCLASVPRRRATRLIVNTNDDRVYSRLSSSGAKVAAIRTDSNGTPGRGKNSVLDVFLAGAWSNLLPIDGDDLYFSGGVRAIERSMSKGTDILFGRFDLRAMDIETPQLASYLVDLGLHETAEDFWRVLALSRRAAERLRYRENLHVGEDTLFQLDGLEADDLIVRSICQYPVYMYRARESGLLGTHGDELDDVLPNSVRSSLRTAIERQIREHPDRHDFSDALA